MIVLMVTNYSTVHVGQHQYCRVSETTWQCYCRFIHWALDEYQTVALMFQGGWGVRLPEEIAQ